MVGVVAAALYALAAAVAVVLALLGYVFVACLWQGARARRLLKRVSLPGPRDSSFLAGAAGDLQTKFNREAYLAMRQWTKEFGATFKVRLGTLPVVVTSDAALMHEILIRTPRVKGDLFHTVQKVFGPGLVFVEHDEWRTHRKFLSPGYAPLSLASYVPTFNKHAAVLVSEIRKSIAASPSGVAQVDMQQLLLRVTLDIVSDVGMRINISTVTGQNPHILEAVATLLSSLGGGLAVLPLGIDYLKLKLRPQMRILNALMQSALDLGRQDKQAADAPPRDLLDVFVAKMKGVELNDYELKAELLTLFLAGHETTANTLTWTFSEIIKPANAHVMAKLRDELEDEMPLDVTASAPLLGQLKYMETVLKETLRMYPPLGLSTRKVENDMEIEVAGKKVFLPAGIEIHANINGVHRSAEYYAKPNEFDPAHFAPGVERPQCAFSPFSQGLRSCVGQPFFWLEGRCLLAALLNNFDFSPVPGFEIRPTSKAGTLRSGNGMPVLVRERQRA